MRWGHLVCAPRWRWGRIAAEAWRLHFFLKGLGMEHLGSLAEEGAESSKISGPPTVMVFFGWIPWDPADVPLGATGSDRGIPGIPARLAGCRTRSCLFSRDPTESLASWPSARFLSTKFPTINPTGFLRSSDGGSLGIPRHLLRFLDKPIRSVTSCVS